MLWDIFCKVIDNHGDIGVCWRLAAALAARGETVRLRVDDASALAWMAPEGADGVSVLAFDDPQGAGDVAIEAFGCELPLPFQAALADATRERGLQPAWINLEYLTAEPFAERNHGLPSPVLSGPAAGLVKRFFYPGFTPRTGGLLRDGNLPAPRLPSGDEQRISLFCYEPAALGALLDRLANSASRTRLLVTAGRATAAVRATGKVESGALTISYLPLLTQEGFDELLASCDLNLVRGEDSLVRALWAGRAFAWQLYPQDDGAHHAKLAAFLQVLRVPPTLAAFHRAWNGDGSELPELDIPLWTAWAAAARRGLLAQEDLATQLMRMARRRAAT